MFVDVSFYTDIFEKELYWISLANKNLLNIYYINGEDGLKDFYINKLNLLEAITNKPRILFIKEIIKEILEEIDNITSIYNSGSDIDIKKLTDLFLVNQLTNNEK